ncbi:MAG: TraB/GumN family protein [Pseudomonadota bacterium]
MEIADDRTAAFGGFWTALAATGAGLRAAGRLAIGLGLAAGICAAASAREETTGATARTAQRPALWAVSDADTTIFLFGSVHALPPEQQWRFAELEAALEAAQAVYFETRLDLIAQARLAFLIARLGVNPEGVRLSDMLGSEKAARMRRAVAELDLEPDAFEAMRPWYAYLSFSAATALAAGASAAHGVDAVLEVEARRARKEVRFFETPEAQIAIFSEMSESDQIAVLEITLDAYDMALDQLAELFRAWGAGDIETIERLAFEGMAAAPPAFFERIYTTRNQAWAVELDRALREEPGVLMAVVGAAHLVGPDSVQALLAARGYDVSRR